MYSMLLPLDANAQRQREGRPLPPSGSWSDLFHACWNAAQTRFAPTRSQDPPTGTPGV